MKISIFFLSMFIIAFPAFSTEITQAESAPQSTEILFPDDLYVELLNSMRKRYINKDITTLNLRKKELEKILRNRSSLDSTTRQRLEIEWIVIHENLTRPIIAD